jgi:hypothetical protein
VRRSSLAGTDIGASLLDEKSGHVAGVQSQREQDAMLMAALQHVVLQCVLQCVL